MKSLIFLLLTVIPLITFGQKAKIEFENTTHNFGNISETGGDAVCDFVFKNTGSSPLILTNVRAGCGCTTPQWSREPIAPNATGSIRVAYNPLHRPGSFIKSVTVNSNAENAVLSLTIRGNVTKAPADPYAAYMYGIGNLKASASSLNFGNIFNLTSSEKSIDIINAGEQPITVTVTPSGKYITTTITPATLEKGQKGKIAVKYNASDKNDWGFVSDKIDITTNENAKGSIAIAANITEDFSKQKAENYVNSPIAEFSENEAELGILEKNAMKRHEFFIQNNGKSDLVIHKIKTSDASVTATASKMAIKPGKKAKVTVNLKTDDKPGKKTKIVSFTLNDPKKTIVSYKLTGNIQ